MDSDEIQQLTKAIKEMTHGLESISKSIDELRKDSVAKMEEVAKEISELRSSVEMKGTS